MSMSGTDVVVAPVSVNKEVRSYVQWGPIIGGAVIATAISTIMTVFGSAIGLSMVSANLEKSASVTAVAIAAQAASAPLSSMESGSPARSRACLSVSQVSKPKPIGTPVSNATRESPLVAASLTNSK